MLICASYSRYHFRPLSSPLAHISMAWCLPLRTLHVTNMSHLGQRGRGYITSSRITTLSCMWQCTKCARSALRLVSLPRNPPTGQVVSCEASTECLYRRSGCVPGERRGVGSDDGRKRRGGAWRWPFGPMGDLWRQFRSSNTLGGCSQLHMKTGRWWLET